MAEQIKFMYMLTDKQYFINESMVSSKWMFKRKHLLKTITVQMWPFILYHSNVCGS